MLSSFFKQNKNKKYSYTPRYYDERKERLENMKKKYGDNSKESLEMRMRGKIRRHQTTKIPGLFSNATLRTFIILGILFVIFYYILKNLNLDF